MKKILFIVGSKRKESFNRQLAKLTESLIANRADVSYLDFSNIPLMDQDIEYPAPEEIERVRKQCLSSDALWFFTPEYNHSYPGYLKNLLDWLSRPLYKNAARSENVLNGKLFTISTAAGASGGSFVREKLIELLTFVNAKEATTTYTGITLDREAFTTGVLNADTENLKVQITELLDALVNN